MKKYIVTISILLLLATLTACGSSKSQSQTLETEKVNYTRSFDQTTNQVITFGDIELQIPKEWSATESGEGVLQIDGTSESQAGPMWLELIDTGATERDLSDSACQQAILDAYVQMMSESFDDVRVANSSYNDHSQLFFASIEASAYDIPAKCGVCAFVENKNLYVYLVPYMDGDDYDYSLDVQEIVKSVTTSAEAEIEETFTPPEAPLVTYDSIVAGNHANEIVCIEAIVSSYEYDETLEMYSFDLWYWSDKENNYIQDEGCFIFADDYLPEAVEPLETFDDGDVIRMVLEVYSDNSFGPSGYIWSELVEKGDLEDAGIQSEQTPSIEPAPGQTGPSTADTSDIDVRFEYNYIDGERLHLTVFTKNNSEETFSGNVYVTFYSTDGKDRLGSDTVIVDELLPGRESWADVVVDAYRGTPKMTADFSEVSFTPIKEIVAEVDNEATENTKSSFYWNFDGVSWYNDVTDIVVYTDGTCVVTVKSNPSEKGQFYASTIWSCGHEHGVKTVQVTDPDGSILAVY